MLLDSNAGGCGDKDERDLLPMRSLRKEPGRRSRVEGMRRVSEAVEEM